MMYQGVLGTFFFTVTDAEVATFRDLKQQREIQFAEHKCVSGLPKVQHTGRNLDTLSLTVQLFPLTPLALTVDMRIRRPARAGGARRGGAARARPDLLRPVRAQKR